MEPAARLIEIKKMYTTQNPDRIARRQDYAHLAADQLLVRTLFATLQGEGPFVGTPCVFVRLAGCNLGDKESFCQWCDTAFELDQGRVMTFGEVRTEMEAAWVKNVLEPSVPQLLVLTGGEPGLQPGTPDFMAHVISNGWRVQVETNGTQRQLPQRLLVQDPTNITLVVSPKAGPNGYGALDVELWAGATKGNVLKLVVDSNPASPHFLTPSALRIANAWRAHCGPRSVYLSPMAIYLKEYKGEVSSAWEPGLVDPVRTSKNYNYAYQECMAHGFLLSIQQHLFAEAP